MDNNKFIYILLYLKLLVLLSSCVYGKLININLSSNYAQLNGGQILTSFTFTSGGNGVVTYKLSSNWKIVPKLYIFPYFTDMPLPVTPELISPTNCRRFFEKAMQLMELHNLTGRITMGKFSGPFPVMLVYADQLTCTENLPNILPIDSNKHVNIKDKGDTLAHKPHHPSLKRAINEDLRIEIQLLNSDHLGNSTEHLSAEETGLVGFFQLLLLTYFVVGCISIPRLWTPISKPGPMQAVLRLVTLVASLQFLASICFFSHLYRYSNYGIGYKWFETIAELLDIACHYLLLLLIVSWTLAGRQHAGFTWTHGTGKFIAMLSLIQLICFLWSEVVSISSSPTWERDQQIFRNGLGLGSSGLGLSGAFLFTIRLVVACIFAMHLLKASKKERSPIKRDFFESFAMISLVWFLSYPVFYVIGFICTDYLRYKFVTVCVSLCQAGAICFFYKLFLSRSLFWEVSALSGTLPIVMKFDKSYGLKASP